MDVIKKITESELEVLKVVWDKDIAISSAEINERLKQIKNWDKSTTRTLVYRLVDKGALIAEKKDMYYYLPTITEKEYLAEQTKSFIQKFYKGNAKNLVASLFEQDCIDREDINELKQIWSEGEKESE